MLLVDEGKRAEMTAEAKYWESSVREISHRDEMRNVCQ